MNELQPATQSAYLTLADNALDKTFLLGGFPSSLTLNITNLQVESPNWDNVQIS